MADVRDKKIKSSKYFLVLRDIDTMKETVVCIYSRARLLFFSFFCVFVLGIVMFWLFNTVFSKWVNPLHYYGISSEKFNQVVETIIELEKKAKQNEAYVEMLQSIINQSKENPSEFEKRVKYPVVSADSVKGNRKDKGMHFFVPVNGQIVDSFRRCKDKNFVECTTILAHDGSKLCAIAEGVVLIVKEMRDIKMHVTTIKHKGDAVCDYYFFGKIVAREGDLVDAGGVIADLSSVKGCKFNSAIRMIIGTEVVNAEEHIVF